MFPGKDVCREQSTSISRKWTLKCYRHHRGGNCWAGGLMGVLRPVEGVITVSCGLLLKVCVHWDIKYIGILFSYGSRWIRYRTRHACQFNTLRVYFFFLFCISNFVFLFISHIPTLFVSSNTAYSANDRKAWLAIFWDVAPCSPCMIRLFGWTYHHLPRWFFARLIFLGDNVPPKRRFIYVLHGAMSQGGSLDNYRCENVNSYLVRQLVSLQITKQSDVLHASNIDWLP
jgi:hypothetical protein